MVDRLNAYLNLHASALSLRGERMNLIASNLANADTPGYKAKDLDFSRAMKAATGAAGSERMRVTDDQHLSIAGSARHFVVSHEPLQGSLDQNTVDPQLQHAAFAENALGYQASLQFLEGKVRGLMTAITGE